MNRDMIIEQLEKWEENEIFYRDFYQFTNGNLRNEEELQNFLEERNPSEEERSMVLHPSENREYVAEEQYFHGDCNVVLTKHPRYVPYFMHRHAFFEMIYVLSGKCTQVFEDCEISLKKGDLCLMAPEVCHGIGVFDDSVVINILIRHSTFLDIFLNTIRDKSQISLFFWEICTRRIKQDIFYITREGMFLSATIFWICIGSSCTWIDIRTASPAAC